MGNLVFQATLGGQVNLVGPNTASTFNINVPTVNGNMVTTGDTGTVTNTMCATSVYTAPGTIGSGTPNTGAFTTLTTTSTINNLTVGRGAGSVSTNTAVGASALAANTTGDRNFAAGGSALAANTTGAQNSASGYFALTTQTTGNYNAAFGAYALNSNTTASNNTAAGYTSLYSNTTGASNTGVGFGALFSNTTASNNTAVGYQAGYSGTTGVSNTALGAGALFTSTTGNAITAIGKDAGRVTTVNGGTYIGESAGLAATTGTYNTFIGSGTGYLVTTGGKNTIVGCYSGNQGGLDIRTSSNYIVLSDGDGNPRGIFNNAGGFMVGTVSTIGSGSAAVSVEGTGGVIFGIKSSGGSGNECTFNWNNSTTGNNLFTSFYTEGTATGRGSIDYNRAGGLTRYNTTSDATLKNIIGDSDGAKSVEILNSTRIREYSWKEDQANKTQIGVIAQELYETFSGAVSVGGDKVSVDEEGNETTQYVPWAVDKTAFTFHLVAGWQAHERIIQEQQAIITALTARIEALENQA